MYKKILWALVLFILIPQASFANFPDVPEDHANIAAINKLAKEGIIEGYPDGTFKPDNPVNRAELIKMTVMMKAAVDNNYSNCFPDVVDDWYAKYVCYALEQAWIQGYPDGTFQPGNNVNRAEAIKIILNAMVPEEEWPELTAMEYIKTLPAGIDADAWYGKYFRTAYVKDYLDMQHSTQNNNGTINYFPGGDMTRKEVAEMIYRIQFQ